MGSFNDYLENAFLDHITGRATLARPATWIALSTSDYGEAGTGGNEPAAGSYARVQVNSWTAAVSRTTENFAVVTFPTATDSWGSVSHWAICASSTGGNVLAYGQLASAKNIVNGNKPSIAAGEIDVTINASGITTYLANRMLNHIFTVTSYAAPTISVGLSTGTPLDTGSGMTEVYSWAYARVATVTSNWQPASGGITYNCTSLTFTAPTGQWGTMTHVGWMDAASGGNILFYAALGTSQAPSTGDTVYFVVGSLSVTIA